MDRKEALKRFKGDLEFLKLNSTKKTNQMAMYEIAIEAIETMIKEKGENYAKLVQHAS